MRETYGKQTPEQLVTVLEIILGAGDALHNALGLTGSELQAAQAAANETSAAIVAKSAAVAQVTATSEAKLAGKAKAVAALNAMLRTALSSPATSAQLAAAGFPPRRSSVPRPATPQMVTGLSAVPSVNGTVRITHDRSGNGPRTTFVLESSAEDEAWTMISAGSRVTTVLTGYAPGVTQYFRVTAVNAGASSLPSDSVGIYAPARGSSRGSLRVVAGKAA